MRYSRVYIDAIGYELAPVVVSTAELEARLQPLYDRLRLSQGQLELMTGIHERRWWEPGQSIADGAVTAARNALAAADVRPNDIDVLIYAGVCREQFEPATACHVAAALGVSPGAFVYDVSNACLGMLNGIVDVANRIELGQCRAGLVVACETARDINELTIEQLTGNPDIELFKSSLAALTGGSGAAAVLVTDGSFAVARRRKLVGGATQTAPQHFGLCRWGLESIDAVVQKVVTSDPAQRLLSGGFGLKHCVIPFTSTDAASVLKFGVDLGLRTWTAFRDRLGWAADQVDKVVTHQVGAGHREAILRTLGIPAEKDFSTFPYLGNMGTVSLPLTAALAEEREFIRPGDRVGFLGIGSGLNCLMLGLQY
ncbi:MAG TPA: 3-oxoacyl-ACP synthase III [Gemmataceae bacterium]|jgi:3-oxoacyl-[acyl-carrier-protein] synthase-3